MESGSHLSCAVDEELLALETAIVLVGALDGAEDAVAGGNVGVREGVEAGENVRALGAEVLHVVVVRVEVAPGVDGALQVVQALRHDVHELLLVELVRVLAVDDELCAGEPGVVSVVLVRHSPRQADALLDGRLLVLVAPNSQASVSWPARLQRAVAAKVNLASLRPVEFEHERARGLRRSRWRGRGRRPLRLPRRPDDRPRLAGLSPRALTGIARRAPRTAHHRSRDRHYIVGRRVCSSPIDLRAKMCCVWMWGAPSGSLPYGLASGRGRPLLLETMLCDDLTL